MFYTSELEFQLALENYVHKLFIDYGAEKIPQEYFLINLMRLVNKEVSNRLGNAKKARAKYFAELHDMLDEIEQLKHRLRSSNIKELDRFTSDLEKRITFTIDESEINFKKKKVFEDALQMIYVAEEMIKLDQVQEPEGATQFNRKLDQSKQKLLGAFGEDVGTASLSYGERHSVYDLFNEWKNLDQKKFSLRLADVRLARQNLIKSSGREEVLRMFNDELRLAYNTFNDHRYDLSDRLLEDILQTYPVLGIKNLDDVYFYRAECNFALERYLHAQKIFQELLEKYPGTVFLPRAYSRLVEINYTLENYDRAVEYVNLYLNVASAADPVYHDTKFLAAMANYQLGDYNRAIELLSDIPPGHSYYYFAQYFIGNAYAVNQKYNDAVDHYLIIVEGKKVPNTLYPRALYKLGILEYERKNYFAAMSYLEQISPLYVGYDKVLNALAWTNYEYEQSKPPNAIKDYTYAKYYARRLLLDYYASPYRMEAESMLAYISQLENEPAQALNLYQNVYQTKVNKANVEEYLTERSKFNDLYYQALNLQEKAFQKLDKNQYMKAQEMLDKLESKNMELDLAEVSGVGLAAYQEINKVLSQLDELNRLKRIADSHDDFQTVEKIDSLQTHLLVVLDRFPTKVVEKARIVNLFDEYPVSQLVAEQDNQVNQFDNTQQKIMTDIADIDEKLRGIDKNIKEAELKNDYKLVTALEREQSRLTELKKYYDNLISMTYTVKPQKDLYSDFGKWGDFGAFGIINVQFYQQQQIQTEMTDLSLTLNRVNKDLDYRKQVIEDKVKKIEAEIRFMTMKARVEERARQRAERERAFRENYFDTRAGESQEE